MNEQEHDRRRRAARYPWGWCQLRQGHAVRARLRHAVYYTACVATIVPILLLELGGKLAGRMEWAMFGLQEWSRKEKP
jgi:hypothetical protein